MTLVSAIGVFMSWWLVASHLTEVGGWNTLVGRIEERTSPEWSYWPWTLDVLATFGGIVFILCLLQAILTIKNSKTKPSPNNDLARSYGLASFAFLPMMLLAPMIYTGNPYLFWPVLLSGIMCLSFSIEKGSFVPIFLALLLSASTVHLVVENNSVGLLSDSSELFYEVENIKKNEPEADWIYDVSIEPWYQVTPVNVMLRDEIHLNAKYLPQDEFYNIILRNEPTYVLTSDFGESNWNMSELFPDNDGYCLLASHDELKSKYSKRMIKFWIWKKC
jgi:hypothetical protein